MIRHVVIFTWSDAADAPRRAASVQALRRLRQDVGGMLSLVVAEDAASPFCCSDFPTGGVLPVRQDPVHLASRRALRPWLAAPRLQYQI